MKKILITAALPYINNQPHMGHIAGSHLPADVFARFCRSRGHKVVFVGGSDEYGTPSFLAAKAAKTEIKEFVDSLHSLHKKIYEKMNISYDIYSRTSNDSHTVVVQNFFKDISPEYLEEKEEELYYSEEDKMFLPDRFLIGECPACFAAANSDQCESCGKILTAKELLNPRSTLSNSKPILKKTKHIYLRLDLMSKALDNWLSTKIDIFKKNVYSEAKKWIDDLKSRSITRDMSWGVKVPLQEYENKVFYVWFDAPIGYITFSKMLGVNWDEYDTYHFLGKDNIPFHTIFWPAMLISANKKLPYNVVGYNYLTFEGEKFSKSKNIGVFCKGLLNSDVDIDIIRFYLLFSLPESKDADFRWGDLATVINSNLIGNVANFFNRTLSMINRYFNGVIEVKSKPSNELIDSHELYKKEIEHLLEKCELRNCLKKILEFSSLGNAYIENMEPWKIAKDDKEALANVLYSCLEHVRVISSYLKYFIPSKIEQFLDEQLNFNKDGEIPLKHCIKSEKPLFKKIDDQELILLKKALM